MAQITPDELRTAARYGTWLPRPLILAAALALEAANKRIAELEAELDAARRWYRL